MKRLTLFLVLMGLLAACSQPTPTLVPTLAPTSTPKPEAAVTVEFMVPDAVGELEAQAQAFVDLLVEGSFDAAVELFDDTMTEALPADQLQEIWLGLNLQVGVYQEQLGTRVEEQAPYQIVYVVCQFEAALIDVKVVFDETALIAGLFFAPSAGLDSESRVYSAPDYVDSTSFEEVEIVVGDGEWELPGTLTLPLAEDGPFPAVVLVHGSGPNDRDESIGPNKPFRDLAWGLASQGLVVLRYDKRTRVYAEELAAMDEITVQEETIDDALAAVALLRETENVDPERIFVLGHSLGGMLAPRIAASDPSIAGIIVLAGNTRPLEDLILAQIGYLAELDGSVSDSEQQQLFLLEQQVDNVKDDNLSERTPAAALPMEVPAHYWLDLRGYDPAAAAAGLDLPMLIMQGVRDYQVTEEEDYQGWQTALAGRPDVAFRLYAGLNHLFIEGEGKGTPDEYQLPGNVAGYVLDDIVSWLTGQ